MIRIYGMDEETIYIERSKSRVDKISIKIDQTIEMTIDSFSIKLDYATPSWGFKLYAAESPWEIRLKPFRPISMLLEVDCPQNTIINHMIIGA